MSKTRELVLMVAGLCIVAVAWCCLWACEAAWWVADRLPHGRLRSRLHEAEEELARSLWQAHS